MPYYKKYKKYRKIARRGKRTLGRQTYRLIKAIATKAITKKAETKYAYLNRENVQLYHNVGESGGGAGPYTAPATDASFFNVWAQIQKGTNVYNRIGNEIYPRGMALRLWLANKDDRPNLHYRIVIGCLPKQNQSSVATSATNCNWMENYLNVLNGYPNHDLGVKVFYDKVVKNEIGFQAVNTNNGNSSNFTRKESHKWMKIFIKRKKANKIVFNDTTNVIVNKPVFLAVIPYDSYGTLVTDNVASMAYSCKLYFKDI